MGIMRNNIDKVLERDSKIQNLNERSGTFFSHSLHFLDFLIAFFTFFRFYSRVGYSIYMTQLLLMRDDVT